MEGRERIITGVALSLIGAVVIGTALLGLVEVVATVALPLAVLALAGGTLLVGTSAPTGRSGRTA
jgi:hypothetical protein